MYKKITEEEVKTEDDDEGIESNLLVDKQIQRPTLKSIQRKKPFGETS